MARPCFYRVCVIVIAVFHISVVAYAVEPSEPQTMHYSQKELLKNWALSVCLAQIATDAKSQQDANATASAYLEFGQQPMETYEALRGLVEQFVARKYAGSIASEFKTMKCIDLFHSKALDTLSSALVAP